MEQDDSGYYDPPGGLLSYKTHVEEYIEPASHLNTESTTQPITLDDFYPHFNLVNAQLVQVRLLKAMDLHTSCLQIEMFFVMNINFQAWFCELTSRIIHDLSYICSFEMRSCYAFYSIVHLFCRSSSLVLTDGGHLIMDLLPAQRSNTSQGRFQQILSWILRGEPAEQNLMLRACLHFPIWYDCFHCC